MCTAAVDRKRSHAFTLLEITLAVAILSMMSLVIYRFVQTNLIALRVSAEANAKDESYSGLLNLLNAQLPALSPGQGSLLGETFKFSDRRRDEITWICGAGPGLLTRYGGGEFSVNLRLRPSAKNSDRMELGVIRKPHGDPNIGSGEGESWVTLMPDVQSLKISYFDPRLNVWVDKWKDFSNLPRLVKVAIGRPGNPAPWEAIIAIARTPF
ncbi:MAG: prepilin-type N-terminal cleavage/methylation domain-containing protein [Verrucomicrobiota bacterium]